LSLVLLFAKRCLTSSTAQAKLELVILTSHKSDGPLGAVASFKAEPAFTL